MEYKPDNRLILMDKMNKLIHIIITVCIICHLTGCQNSRDHEYQGYIEGELVYLASPFSGHLQTLETDRGDSVVKGQPLFALDPEPERSQLQQAEHQLQQSKAKLHDLEKGQRDTVLAGLIAQIEQTSAEVQLAKEQLERNQRLFRKGAIDEDSLSVAKSNYQQKYALLQQRQANLAEAKQGNRRDIIAEQQQRVNEAQANLSRATWALAKKSIAAPTNATVFDTFFKQDEWVAAGTAVLALLAPENVRVIFFIPEQDLSHIQRGQKVKISCDNCKKSFMATISYISPEAEFTPPVIYSREHSHKLIYRIKARPVSTNDFPLHPGQPVYIDRLES